jgi:formylglycine-generating enzyme required for sulfatase activity
MGKYEISRELIEKANGEGNLGITLWDMTEFGGNGPDKPATGVTWMEAATFVNWLNTSSGYAEAYQLRGGKVELWQPGEDGYDAAGPLRNGQARYVLPSFNEWHKAAYYDSGAGTYYLYPTGSNARPRAVSNGTEPYTAVYDQTDEVGPADITLAGALSPYGTMGQGGNAWEWNDTPVDFQQSLHVMGKGGDFRGSYDGLVSSYYAFSPASAVDDPFVVY